MAAPGAPMPLVRQVAAGGTVVVTVPLQGLGPSPAFTIGGTTFNAGNPTATYTLALPASGASKALDELLGLLDRLQREGDAVVT